MLEAFKKAKAEQEAARQAHLKYLAKKRKAKEKLMNQLAVGGLVFLIGSIIAVFVVGLIIQTFGG